MALNLTTPVETDQDTTAWALHPNHPFNKGPEIIVWLQSLSSDLSDLAGPFDPPIPTIGQYQDFFHHFETRARALLQHLDTYEYKYRSIGLAYHHLPWAVRHSEGSATAHINQRLTQIFDTNTSRRNQAFFKHWYEIRDRVVNVLTQIKLLTDSADFNLLRENHGPVEMRIQAAEKLFPDIDGQLHNVGSLVERIKNAAIAEDRMRGIVDLKWRYTKEGTSLRRWVYTLDEVDGMVRNGADAAEVRVWTEWLIEGWLADGVSRGVSWSWIGPHDDHTEV